MPAPKADIVAVKLSEAYMKRQIQIRLKGLKKWEIPQQNKFVQLSLLFIYFLGIQGEMILF